MTFDKFADILVMSRVVAPEAVSDPDNYDDSCTLENVRAAYRRLTTPTTGMTFVRRTDLSEATAPVRLTNDQIGDCIADCIADDADTQFQSNPIKYIVVFARAVEAAVLRANGFDVQPTEAGGLK